MRKFVCLIVLLVLSVNIFAVTGKITEAWLYHDYANNSMSVRINFFIDGAPYSQSGLVCYYIYDSNGNKWINHSAKYKTSEGQVAFNQSYITCSTSAYSNWNSFEKNISWEDLHLNTSGQANYRMDIILFAPDRSVLSRKTISFYGLGVRYTQNTCLLCSGRGLCNICHGTNKCSMCRGTGLFSLSTASHIICTYCKGDGMCSSVTKCYGGRCPTCKGTGVTSTILQGYTGDNNNSNSNLGYTNNYNGNYNNNYNNNNQHSNSNTRQRELCPQCGGVGECWNARTQDSYHCMGRKECAYCDGKGYGGHRALSVWNDQSCTWCNASGKCKYCNGTGKCPKCNGEGYVYK